MWENKLGGREKHAQTQPQHVGLQYKVTKVRKTARNHYLYCRRTRNRTHSSETFRILSSRIRSANYQKKTYTNIDLLTTMTPGRVIMFLH